MLSLEKLRTGSSRFCWRSVAQPHCWEDGARFAEGLVQQLGARLQVQKLEGCCLVHE